MIIFLIILFCYGLIYFCDFRPMIKKGNKKIILFYGICFTVTLVVVLCHCLGINLYGPTQILNQIGEAIGLIK